MAYEAIIGMEVHAQIITASKMFCPCAADTAAPPNTHVCPVCLGLPGSLPVINEAAVQATILTGLALHCEVPSCSKFDRKNYHYPDLPKGYQISQYDLPLCVNGWLDIPDGAGSKRIRIRRVHLEEDTGRLLHEGRHSLIDYNRAGIPLMEIVTEADLRSADDAWYYLTQLRTILRYLGVSTGNMEEGAMRCEANVSLRPVGSAEFGVKVEIKNLNSFRAVRQAIAYEIERQTALLERGERIRQITVGWDEDRHCTVFQRSKEYAEDYRYFPEPDLPPLFFAPAIIDELRQRLPELPEEKAGRFAQEYGIRREDVALLVAERDVADYFEAVLQAAPLLSPQTVANWILGELFRLLSEEGIAMADIRVQPEALAGLLKLVNEGVINLGSAKEVFAEMFRTGETADVIIERRGLRQISGEEQLATIVAQALAQNPQAVQDYLAGKDAALGFLMGQVMKATRGQANPQVARQLLQEELERRRTTHS
ncbi:MAG: Asp-tRNA(Asn)/Glu-tRNA(Gln) amidotransferase subunit GatB [Chloroflexi bacterium]|nr:Asp-tRNA(Asn)/Glu-tRNA(Gln) amidotransferase subunit GatB [Chloroflexota bacterium]